MPRSASASSDRSRSHDCMVAHPERRCRRASRPSGVVADRLRAAPAPLLPPPGAARRARQAFVGAPAASIPRVSSRTKLRSSRCASSCVDAGPRWRRGSCGSRRRSIERLGEPLRCPPLVGVAASPARSSRGFGRGSRRRARPTSQLASSIRPIDGGARRERDVPRADISGVITPDQVVLADHAVEQRRLPGSGRDTTPRSARAACRGTARRAALSGCAARVARFGHGVGLDPRRVGHDAARPHELERR